MTPPLWTYLLAPLITASTSLAVKRRSLREKIVDDEELLASLRKLRLDESSREWDSKLDEQEWALRIDQVEKRTRRNLQANLKQYSPEVDDADSARLFRSLAGYALILTVVFVLWALWGDYLLHFLKTVQGGGPWPLVALAGYSTLVFFVAWIWYVHKAKERRQQIQKVFEAAVKSVNRERATTREEIEKESEQG